MIIQDNQFALYAQKQSETNGKQLEQMTRLDAETAKEGQDFRTRFDEKAASLSISEKMGSQIFEIRRAVGDLKGNSTDTQIKDVALNQVQGLLRRTNALTIQALNKSNTSLERQSIDKRIKNLKEEIERIARMGEPGTKEGAQRAEERIAAQANQETERVLGLLL